MEVPSVQHGLPQMAESCPSEFISQERRALASLTQDMDVWSCDHAEELLLCQSITTD